MIKPHLYSSDLKQTGSYVILIGILTIKNIFEMLIFEIYLRIIIVGG